VGPDQESAMSLKISIITVCLKSVAHMEKAMKSVFAQTYPHIEYVIIDGGSTDGTVEIINSYRERINYFVSEPDKGLYDAMNKGIKAATGDVLFFLNSDDYFADTKVVEDVAKVFLDNSAVEIVFGNQIFDRGDITFIKRQDFEVTREQLAQTTIQHQTVFTKRHVFQLTNGFSQEYKIVSDFDWMVKVFVVHKCAYRYVDRNITVMATTGMSWMTHFEEERIQVMKLQYTCDEILNLRLIPLIKQKDDLLRKQHDELKVKDDLLRNLRNPRRHAKPGGKLTTLLRSIKSHSFDFFHKK
jgi:glycosyltransferase involved in cell wall biosynthesis